MNSTPAAKKSPFAGGSKLKRAFLFGGLLLIIGIMALVVGSLLSASSKSESENLYRLAAAQADLVELASAGSKQARSTDIRTLAATSEILYLSQNNGTIRLISSDGKVDKKKLASYRNTQFKKALDDAATKGNFDEVFQALLVQRADAYRSQLQNVYASQKNNKTRKELASQYQAVLLVTKRE